MQLKRILLLSAAFAALTLTFACSDKEGGGNDDDKGVKTFEELQTAIDNASPDAATPTKIVLGADIELPAMITVGDSDGTSRAVWLDGRGHKIYRSDIDPSIMSVSTNSRLVLTDITLDGRDGSKNIALLQIETGGAAVLGKGTTLQNTKGEVCSGVQNIGALTVEEGAAFKNIEGSAIYSFTPLRLNGGSFSGNGVDLLLYATQRVVFAEFAKWPAVDGKLKLLLAFIPSGSTVATAAEGYAFPNADGFSLEDLVVPEGSPRELVLEDGAIKIKEQGVKTFEELQTAIDNASSDAANPTKILLGADIELPATITVGGSGSTSRAVSLDGRGHKIYLSGSLSDPTPWMMSVSANSRLVLTDITLDGRDVFDTALLYIGTNGAAVLGKGTTLQNTKGLSSGVANEGFLTVEDGATFKNIEDSAIASYTPLRLNGGSFSGNGADLKFVPNPDKEVFAEFAKWPAVDGKLKLQLLFIPTGSTVATAVEGYAFPNADGFSLEDIGATGKPRELVLEDGAIKIKETQ